MRPAVEGVVQNCKLHYTVINLDKKNNESLSSISCEKQADTFGLPHDLSVYISEEESAGGCRIQVVRKPSIKKQGGPNWSVSNEG